ncbi:SET domain-containing protein [Pseudomonas sp. IT-347P]|uniref:hypothetical protein n=1 Tax=Pseudomonas sp. IT-347P TaxID=3026458 RepID=UPI0039E183F0
MPVKPPIRVITTATVHGTRLSDPLPRLFPRPAFEGGLAPTHLKHTPSTTTRKLTDTTHNVITPEPPRISVSSTANPAPAPALPERPLSDYLITSLVVLPEPDAQGISHFRGRQYAEVPGGNVPIGLDPASGLYRAKLPNELTPSGPFLQRRTQSLLWLPVERLVPLTYPLSTARLKPYQTDLDFSRVDPGSDGLHRFNGKLYASIEQHAYQVLHDLDASSPNRAVMRIVHAGDPVATHADNRYVASRPGNSEPIVFDTQHGWRGTIVYGAAGMPKTVAEPPSGLEERLTVAAGVDRRNQRIQNHDETRQNLIIAWQTAKAAEGEHAQVVRDERTALVRRELHSHQELESLGEALQYYEDNKPVIRTFTSKDDYRNIIIALQKGKMLAYQYLVECGLTRRALEGPLLDLDPERLPRTIGFLTTLLGHLKKRQRIADHLVKKWKVSPEELSVDVLSEMDTHNVVASWVFTKSILLDNSESTGSAPQASELAIRFGQATFVYGALGRIPDNLHAAVLSDLSQQCAALRDWYDRLDLPEGPEHVTSRNDINAEINAFEHTLETRLARIYHEQADGSAVPVHEQPIDFDFIPPQDRSGTPATTWRLFRAKKHGVYKLNVGKSRRTALGEEVIDVGNLFDPTRPVQTYVRRDGEWHAALTTTQEKALPALRAEADQLLQASDSHVNAAYKEEQGHLNPDNIVEALEKKAKALDHTAQQLQAFANTDANARALIQRLTEDSQRLQTVGENIRIRIYKDQNFLSVDRLIYLIDRGHVRARKSASRLKRGKGNDREYLDIYSLTDAQTGAALWEAHFHYRATDTPALNFNVRGAHLKTLEQSAQGSMSQRREERAGRQHVAIWRQYLDGRTAQRVFDLAATTADRVR